MELTEDTLINDSKLKDRIFQSLMSVLISYHDDVEFKRQAKYLESYEGKEFRIYRPES